jgi:hypothetical protein
MNHKEHEEHKEKNKVSNESVYKFVGANGCSPQTRPPTNTITNIVGAILYGCPQRGQKPTLFQRRTKVHHLKITLFQTQGNHKGLPLRKPNGHIANQGNYEGLPQQKTKS